MKLAIIGTGYVGLTTGTCLANLGNDIICVDVDESKIEKLKKGIVPFFEPGLQEMTANNLKSGRLEFTTNYADAIPKSEVIFICVGTPQEEDGSVNLKYVFSAVESIAKHMNSYKVIVNKSTVPVGTADKVRELIRKNTPHDFGIVSNPEFLREGSAIKDFMNPDRIIIGVNNKREEEIMTNIYRGLERIGQPIVVTDVKSSELIKYAANCMLATRISFMNMLANLCYEVGADIKQVAKGIGLDDRIGPRFLQAGIGYGGSCFPKDVKGLMQTLEEHGCDNSLVKAVDNINYFQTKKFAERIELVLGSLKGRKIAVCGLSFKPKTDDIRESSSIKLIKMLKEKGAEINAYDPVAIENSKKELPDINYCTSAYDALDGSDCLVLATEWDEFRYLDKNKVKNLLRQPIIFDGRNIYDPQEIKEAGFIYVGIGRRN